MDTTELSISTYTTLIIYSFLNVNENQYTFIGNETNMSTCTSISPHFFTGTIQLFQFWLQGNLFFHLLTDCFEGVILLHFSIFTSIFISRCQFHLQALLWCRFYINFISDFNPYWCCLMFHPLVSFGRINRKMNQERQPCCRSFRSASNTFLFDIVLSSGWISLMEWILSVILFKMPCWNLSVVSSIPDGGTLISSWLPPQLGYLLGYLILLSWFKFPIL